MSRAAANVLSVVVRAYQVFLRPFLPPACRFEPSCSDYCLQALAAHGTGRGMGLTFRRIGRCHPWHRGGHDPVPEPDIRQRSLRGG